MNRIITTVLFLVGFIVNAQELVFKPIENNSEWSIDFTGKIQADVIIDNKKLNYIDGYLPTYITSNKTDYNTYFTMRQTLLGMGINNEKAGVRGFIEVDFIGPNNQTQLRLRKIYLTYKKWLIGQDWSNLNDLGTWPKLLDFNGPNAALYARRMQIRYSDMLNKKTTFAFSIEDPNTPSVSLPIEKYRKKQIIPNFVTSVKYGSKNYIRAAAILSPISYQYRKDSLSDFSKTRTTFGFGVHASSVLYVNKLSNFKLVGALGSGIATNVISFWEEGYDAIPDLNNPQRIKKLPVFSTVIAYENWWNSKWSSVLFYSYSTIGDKKYMQKNMYKNVQHFGVNTVYQPTSYFKTGFDFTYGFLNRYQISETFQSARLQLSTVFMF